VSFAAITLSVASQQVFIVVSLHFVTDSVRKRWDTSSYYQQDMNIISISNSFFMFVPIDQFLLSSRALNSLFSEVLSSSSQPSVHEIQF
jgi:hypothetical protein